VFDYYARALHSYQKTDFKVEGRMCNMLLREEWLKDFQY
jgi:hypothetical protein